MGHDAVHDPQETHAPDLDLSRSAGHPTDGVASAAPSAARKLYSRNPNHPSHTTHFRAFTTRLDTLLRLAGVTIS